MSTLSDLLEVSAAHHRHLCPRQVLGVRMGLLAGEWLNLPLPQEKKRLLTIVETDGCFADGVSAATNCWVGRRTLRVVDYGKVAAVFVDTHTNQTIRIYPSPQARELAPAYAPEAKNRWEGYLWGYQRIPADLLFVVQQAQLKVPVSHLISRAGARVTCGVCGEEVINEREVYRQGLVLCQSCAGESYYGIATDGNDHTSLPVWHHDHAVQGKNK